MKILYGFCLAALSALPLSAAEKVLPAVKDALALPPQGGIRLSGWIGGELNTCYHGRMLAQSVPDLVAPFQKREEDKFWQTEFWGKWFTSAALAYRYQPDAPLRAQLDQAVTGLLAAQTPDGYLGNYKPAAQPTKGWDVWGRKYVMLGLLAYYDLTGDARALAGAMKEADYTMTQIGPGKIEIQTCGQWTGLAACSILEPMVLLYRRTGEDRYLEFAQYIVRQWEAAKGPDLLRKALAGKSVYDMFPGPDPKQKGYMSGGLSKAYEMMSCYEGLLELYRVTGQPEYLQAVKHVAANIAATEITILGSGSSWERWCQGRTRQTEPVPEWMETCVTATWIKLNAQLLRLTGAASYADPIEQAAYNALLASQKTDGTWWCHYNPLEGHRLPAPEQCKMHMNCCVASGPRALALLPALSVMQGAAGPVVNFYEAAKATVPVASQNVTLEIKGDYPRGNAVEVCVNPSAEARFTLSLRIPAWSAKTRAELAGQALDGVKAGEYLRIDRTWKPGDCVRLQFDLATRVVRDPGRSTRIALTRGPLTLAIDKRITTGVPGAQQATIVEESGVVPAVAVSQTPPAKVFVAVDVPFRTADGRTVKLRMCDYASAGRTWDESSTLRVWLPQPLSAADPFAGIVLAKTPH